jgi:hypothetical protein
MTAPIAVTPSPTPAWRVALHQPALRACLGLLFFILFTWPFLGIVRPFNTWLFLYASWTLSIGVLALLSLGRPATPDDADPDPASK